MGWGRVLRYWTFKLKRLQGSPYAIACGFACGAAVSFTPLIGFHFILAAVLAWALRGNIIASAIGTIFEEPGTVLLPMLVGGLPAAVVVWMLIFFPIRRVVGNYQHHRQARRLRRRRILDEERRARLDPARQADDDITIPDAAPEAAKGDAQPVAANVTHLDQVLVDRGR